MTDGEAQSQVPEVLQRPLYAFSLPAALLGSLSVKANQGGISSSADISQVEAGVRNPQPQASHDGDKKAKSEQEPAKATSCSLCSLQFASLDQQRRHVRSDLHKYNLKQRLKGLPSVSDDEFERLIGDLDESITGSEDSDDSTSDNNHNADSTLTALLRRQARIAADDGAAPASKVGSPYIWLRSSLLAPHISLGIYRALFATSDYEYAVDALRQKQFVPIPQPHKAKAPQIAPSSSPSYFLCMIGGGHFAAMVVSLAPKLVTTHKGVSEKQAIVLAHKTFHRYTTRRKQGGSQSANDNAKGAAHSAGAGIRRANEAALQQEIRALLSDWKSLIDSCELVFFRATGSENRKTLFGPYEGQVLRSNDARNRGFPFTTRRATQSELMRAFQELTRVKVSQIDETVLKAEEQVVKVPDATDSKARAKPAKLSAEDEAAIHHSGQMSALIKRSKVPALVTYIQSNHLDLGSFLFKQAGYASPLHMASALGSVPVVSALLLKCGASPLLRNEDGKTSFEVAKDRATRDAFRLARFRLGEDVWPWDDAGVAAALDPADAAARAQRDKEAEAEEAALEAARRKAETERLRRETMVQDEAATERRIGKGRALGEVTGADKRELEGRGMTPEMRMKLERERRARAAEARMKR